MRVRVVAFTHQGAVREGNEDTIAAGDRVRSEPMLHPTVLTIDETPALALVCDGMGGHAAGEVASRAVAEHLVARRSELTGPDAVRGVVVDANAELFALMDEKPACHGMGTTVAGLVLATDRAITFNVGDSRIYGVRMGRVEQLSTDDTPGEKLADGRTAAVTSSIITQVLGGHAAEPLDVHVVEEPLDGRDAWLIVSDGLTDLVPPDEITAACLGHEDESSVRALFDAAMDAGGGDNVSILLVRPERD